MEPIDSPSLLLTTRRECCRNLVSRNLVKPSNQKSNFATSTVLCLAVLADPSYRPSNPTSACREAAPSQAEGVPPSYLKHKLTMFTHSKGLNGTRLVLRNTGSLTTRLIKKDRVHSDPVLRNQRVWPARRMRASLAPSHNRTGGAMTGRICRVHSPISRE